MSEDASGCRLAKTNGFKKANNRESIDALVHGEGCEDWARGWQERDTHPGNKRPWCAEMPTRHGPAPAGSQGTQSPYTRTLSTGERKGPSGASENKGRGTAL